MPREPGGVRNVEGDEPALFFVVVGCTARDVVATCENPQDKHRTTTEPRGGKKTKQNTEKQNKTKNVDSVTYGQMIADT